MYMALEGLMQWLGGMGHDPVLYLFFFFIFSVLAAIILPIPVEVGLLGIIFQGFSLFGLGVFGSFMILAGVMGLGKAVGSWAVFRVGLKLEDNIHSWERWRWLKWLMEKSVWVVTRLRYIGLYLILIIPGMTDTVPLYIFALMNKEGEVLEMNYFVMTNLLAGFARAVMVGIFVSLGLGLF